MGTQNSIPHNQRKPTSALIINIDKPLSRKGKETQLRKVPGQQNVKIGKTQTNGIEQLQKV